MPLTVNPNVNFTSAATQAAFKTELDTLLNELRTNGAALADCRGMKNRLINGAFSINQAGLTTAADAVYHLDQWYALTESGSVTIAQQTNQENGQPTSLRMTQPDVGAKRIGSAQPIETANCRDLRGQTVALRARIRCSSSQAIRWAVIEWTGTADAITKDVVNSWTNATFTTGNFFISTTTTIAATGSVTPAANTWTDLLASATISSSANNLIVFIWSEGTLAQNATLDLGAVQLVQGAQTPFEVRPFGLELALAQRYFERNTYDMTTMTSGGYTNSYSAFRPYMTQKFTTPTVTIYPLTGQTGSAGNATLTTAGANSTQAVTLVNASVHGHSISFTGSGSYELAQYSFTATSRL
jgi:hypothetical protein